MNASPTQPACESITVSLHPSSHAFIARMLATEQFIDASDLIDHALSHLDRHLRLVLQDIQDREDAGETREQISTKLGGLDS